MIKLKIRGNNNSLAQGKPYFGVVEVTLHNFEANNVGEV